MLIFIKILGMIIVYHIIYLSDLSIESLHEILLQPLLYEFNLPQKLKIKLYKKGQFLILTKSLIKINSLYQNLIHITNIKILKIIYCKMLLVNYTIIKSKY